MNNADWLYRDTEIWVLHHSHVLQDILLLLIFFFRHLKVGKPFWAFSLYTNRRWAWFGPWAVVGRPLPWAVNLPVVEISHGEERLRTFWSGWASSSRDSSHLGKKMHPSYIHCLPLKWRNSNAPKTPLEFGSLSEDKQARNELFSESARLTELRLVNFSITMTSERAERIHTLFEAQLFPLPKIPSIFGVSINRNYK